ncbi:hypothetical protein S7335_571 [Synechococcus sp. PCC 7335]|nr:hypothetical protein S7335_571 [Synechococcus sp. PCC 7335]
MAKRSNNRSKRILAKNTGKEYQLKILTNNTARRY